MKLSQKILVGLAIAGIAGFLIYILKKSDTDTKQMLNQIAEEGYETAQNVLFPGKNIQGKHLQYGPVIPE